MTISSSQRSMLSMELYRALRECQTIPPLTTRFPEITISEAYDISKTFLQERIQRDGESIVGKKIGVTSRSVQEMLGVFQPDFGFLTDVMEYANGSEVPIHNNLIQPRAEAEIAFKLNKSLRGPGIDEAAVLDATEYLVPCFEVVDSRIQDWQIKIQDTIADNASCGVFVLGDTFTKPQGIDFANLKIEMSKNGEPVSEGYGSAVQGNPLTAVAWLANTLGKLGTGFEAGEIILSGSVVPLEPVQAGDELSMKLIGYGSTTISFI